MASSGGWKENTFSCCPMFSLQSPHFILGIKCLIKVTDNDHQKVHLCFFHLGGENKSVVLASTAIQLLDDRKSPIVAGTHPLNAKHCEPMEY